MTTEELEAIRGHIETVSKRLYGGPGGPVTDTAELLTGGQALIAEVEELRSIVLDLAKIEDEAGHHYGTSYQTDDSPRCAKCDWTISCPYRRAVEYRNSPQP